MDRATAAAIYTAPALEALKAFPVTPEEVTLLTVAENVSFRIRDAATGGDYVLRLHRPGYHSLDELVSERAWTRALNDYGVPAPLGIQTFDGRDYVEVSVRKAGERRFVGLLKWTEGKLLAEVIDQGTDVQGTERAYRQLGALEAAMHNQAGAWTPPPEFVRHHLDIDGLLGETPFWGRFWEHPALSAQERTRLLETRAIIRDRLAQFGRRSGTYSLIHADLHPNNVLVTEAGLAVIDFDDAGFGWHAYDIAVALFAVRNDERYEAYKAAFLEGYETLRSLDAESESLIQMFLIVRGMASLGWLAQRPELNTPQYQSIFEEVRLWLLNECQNFRIPECN